MLVHLHSLQLIDAGGSLYPDVGPEEVAEHFDAKGFFAFSTPPMRKVGQRHAVFMHCPRSLVYDCRAAGGGDGSGLHYIKRRANMSPSHSI